MAAAERPAAARPAAERVWRQVASVTRSSASRRCALRIDVDAGSQPQEVGDGGFTDWTAQLLGDAKERCLVSCVSTQRLAAL